jgi:poly [ADP-ribose] polymerase
MSEVSNKVIKLIFVSEDNHNKFYHMFDLGNGTFKVEYGRVDKTKVEENYPISKWDTKYREKTKKGYKDITHLYKEEVNDNSTVSVKETVDPISLIKDSSIRSLVKQLQGYAGVAVKENYKVSSNKVTQLMVSEAQSIMDKLADLSKRVKTENDIKEFNKTLITLFEVIPRQMRHVKDHLISGENLSGITEILNKKISSEQDILDVMAGQVSMNTAVQTTESKHESGIDLLSQLGLEISPVSMQEIDMIKKLLGDNKNQFSVAYKVNNKKTRSAYQKALDDIKLKKEELFWHGSRNQNWFNILQSGLLIRPSGAAYTGSMFGDGVYYADKAQKSIGYTSYSGSYWAKGNDSKAFLALYKVAVGNQKHIHRHDSSCYTLNFDKVRKEGFDSVYAHGGADLRNNEYIIYRPVQCTVEYLVEIK